MTRKAFVLSIFIYSLTALLVAHAQEPTKKETPAADLAVTKLVFSRSIEARQPVDEIQSCEADGERIYGYIEVTNSAEPRNVTMAWSRDGKTRFNYTLEVGRSKRWRTWSYVKATKAMVGEWTVTVSNEAGQELASGKFMVKR